MRSETLVSIIIPCFNHGRYIQESIDSALAQTYPNIEILVMDDGSTDLDTLKFFQDFSHPRVQLFNQVNQGLATARNELIARSKGEYIVPLDSDDKIDPQFVELTLGLAHRQQDQGRDIAVVYTDQILFDGENLEVKMLDYDPDMLLVRNHISVCALIKRAAYDAVKQRNGAGYNPNMIYGYEDWDFWLSLRELGVQMMRVPAPLFLYRRTPGSMIDRATKHHQELIDILIANHSELYKQNYARVFAISQDQIKQSDLQLRDLKRDISNPVWLVKRFIKVVLRKGRQ